MDFLCIVLRAAGGLLRLAGHAFLSARARPPFRGRPERRPSLGGILWVAWRRLRLGAARTGVSAFVACFPGHGFGVHEGEARCCEFAFQVRQKLPTGMV